MFNLQYLFMKTQFTLFIVIATLLCMIQSANETDPNCLLTSMDSSCILCNNSTELYFGWCWYKDDQCSIFADSGCAICQKQSYLYLGWCDIKDQKCKDYSPNGICLSCQNGYIFFGDLCMIDPNCIMIKDSLCTACKNGYYLDDSGGCYIDSLQINCKILSPNGCTSCQGGTDMLLNGICYKCSCLACDPLSLSFACYQKDPNCLQIDKFRQCTKCSSSYYLKSGWCYFNTSICGPDFYNFNDQCIMADPNCRISTKNGCNLCNLGYYLTQYTCYSLCSEHDSSGNCMKCYPGYDFIGELCVYVLKTYNCSYFSRQGQCKLCHNNYSLYDGQCYATIQYCQVYNPQTGGCMICEPAYLLNQSLCSYCLSSSSDASCLSLGEGMTAVNNNGSFVSCGQGCLTCTSAGSTQGTCIASQQGYYLASGKAYKCFNQTCLTCFPGTDTCKSCFDGYTLVAGNCVACTDTNATYCRPTNVSYSVFCSTTYTTSAGKCLPCSSNCLKCDVNGPGNCDSSSCFLNYVQLTGTSNCTACMNSCPKCDPNDIRICLGCGPAQYNSGNGSCFACSQRCLQCNSLTGCSACQLGYNLLNGICYQTLPYPCAIMSSASQCSQCFQGYLLNGSNCILDASPNSTYQQCPKSGCPSLYLVCNITNCQACKYNGPCIFCKIGYYLSPNANITCSICPTGCRDCSSLYYCNIAADGYYLLNRVDGSNNGQVSKCRTPCKTCYQTQNYCLTCKEGYHISGSTCISNSTIVLQIELGPSSSNTSIFNAFDSNYNQLAKSIKNINRLLNSLCQILKSSLKSVDQNCVNVFRVISLTMGPIIVMIQVDANMVLNVTTTKESIYQGLNSQGIDGAQVISITFIVYIPQPSDSTPTPTSNLPLILGLAIGLGLLLIIIVILVLVIIKKRASKAEAKTPNDQTPKSQKVLQGDNSMQDPAVALATQICLGPSPLAVKPSQTNILLSNDQTAGQDEIHADAFGEFRQKRQTKDNTHIATQRGKSTEKLPQM